MKKVVFIVFALLLLFSCSDEQVANLHKFNDLKSTDNTLSFEDLGYDVDYIALESGEESLISELNYIAFSENYIFTASLSPSIIHQFKRNGEFVRKISRNGAGPQEYIEIGHITVNDKLGRLFILDNWGGKVLEYDFEGGFCSSYKFPKSMQKFLVSDSRNALTNSLNILENEKFILSEYSLPKQTNTGYGDALNLTMTENKNVISAFLTKAIFELNDDIIVHPNISNTIYTFNPTVKTLTPRYSFEFDIPMDSKAMSAGWAKLEKSQAVIDVAEDDNYIFATILDQSWQYEVYLIDKKSNEYYKSTLTYSNDFKTDFRPRHQYNNILIDHIDLSSLNYKNSKELTDKAIEDALKFFSEKTGQEITLDSNPIIVTITEKNNT